MASVTRNSKNRRFLRIESMEDRTNPAGNVTVAVVGGDLLVTGDGNANGNVFTITEVSSGNFTITGNNTSINNVGAVNTNALGLVSRDVKVILGTGSDNVTFTGTNSTPLRDVIVTPGNGNDTLNFSNFRARNVTVTQPAFSSDSDTTNLNGMTLQGNVAVTNQAGADLVTVSGNISGSVVVSSLDGADTVNVSGRIGKGASILDTAGVTGNVVNFSALTGGGLTITNPSPASSNVTISNSVVGGLTKITNGSNPTIAIATTTQVANSTFSQGFTLTGGGGIDTASFSNAFFSKTLTVSLGNGNNVVSFANGATVGGAMSVTTGEGNDTITANTGVTGFRSTSVLNLGSGNNSANFSGSNFGSNFSYIGAGGNDVFRTDDVNTVEFFGGNVSFVGGDGTNQCSIVGVSTAIRSQIGGSFVYSGLAGTDTVGLGFVNVVSTTVVNLGAGNDGMLTDDCTYFGNFTFNGGSGDDSLFVETTTTLNGFVEMLGSFTANFGDGVDTLQLGVTNNANSQLMVYGNILGDFRTGANNLAISNKAFHLGYSTF